MFGIQKKLTLQGLASGDSTLAKETANNIHKQIIVEERFRKVFYIQHGEF